MSEEERKQFDSACEDGVLCDAAYCPFFAGRTSRLGACEGDFCEQAWWNFCAEDRRETK